MNAATTDLLPLAGIRVLDLGQYISGPCAAVLLAEMGADVIKVEPQTGDPFRKWESGKLSATFVAFNRGKRSVVLDLKSEKASGTCSTSSAAPTCYSASFAVLAALLERARTGSGRHVEISMLGALVHFLHSAVAKKVVDGRRRPRTCARTVRRRTCSPARTAGH